MNVQLEQNNMRTSAVVPLQPPIAGVGVGLRADHFQYIDENKPAIPWFEVLIDNYMMDAGTSLFYLAKIADMYPLTFHGVGMSLGSSDKLNMDYLSRLKKLIQQFKPAYVSDHLCWTSVNGYHSHDLLPMPYTDEAINILIRHIQQVQDFLEQRILIENVSSYLNFKDSAMQEWEFLKLVAEQADCDILLDINNIYVSATNHNIDAMTYLKHIPVERVKEMHLAGYTDMGSYLLDTHAEAVHEPVWELYKKALEKFGSMPTLIEWDNDIPAFSVLQAEASKARVLMQQVHHYAV